MAKAKVELPNLSNASVPFLIDELGRIKAEKSALETLEEYHKAALKAKIEQGDDKNKTQFKGEKFEMNITHVTQLRLDTEKAREKLAQIGMLEECQNEVKMSQMRFKELKE